MSPLPRVINGLVKSTAVRRSYVIVRSQIAMSAFCIFVLFNEKRETQNRMIHLPGQVTPLPNRSTSLLLYYKHRGSYPLQA